MKRTDVLIYTAYGCGLFAVIGGLAWSLSLAVRDDATADRSGLADQLMGIKARAIVDLREGLATEDYRRMEKGMDDLREAGVVASWYLSNEDYGDAGRAFREALEQMREDVAGRDLSQAKSSLNQLTDSCTACHQRKGNVPLGQDLQPLEDSI